MNALQRSAHRRQGVRRAVVLMPNGLTLFNLFCGIYAIVLATRGQYAAAPGFIVLGGIADTLDGRVARATGTGSRFGEELDSLVDAISFGLAPALIMYLELQQQPTHGSWEWLLVFIFVSCAVMRLARFNVEQAGRKKTHFHGLPSPAAGLTLATYYWFSHTPLYNQTVILFTDSKTLSDLPWPNMLRGLMAMLAALMISDVPYPTVPSIGFSSVRKVLGTAVIAGTVVLLWVGPKEFLFPALLAYVLYGAIKWVVLGFLGRSSRPDEIFGVDGKAHRTPEQRRSPLGRVTPAPVAEHDDDETLLIAHGVELPPEPETETEPELERRSPVSDNAQPVRRKRRRRGRGSRPQGSPSPGPSLPDTPTGPAE